MTDSFDTRRSTRREFLGNTSGRLAGAATLAALSVPRAHAAGSDEIRVAVVGCGGRGGGAGLPRHELVEHGLLRPAAEEGA